MKYHERLFKAAENLINTFVFLSEIRKFIHKIKNCFPLVFLLKKPIKIRSYDINKNILKSISINIDTIYPRQLIIKTNIDSDVKV